MRDFNCRRCGNIIDVRQNYLKLRFDHYFSLYEQLCVDGIELIINKISALPVLSTTYQQFVKMVEDDAEISEITKVIETSPTYTLNLLKIANSAIYSLSTSSVRQAIVHLGILVVKDIIISTEVFNVLQVKGTILEREFKLFVAHSEISNIIFHTLYRKANGEKVPEEFETACLLQDIGKLVILHFFPKEYKEIMSIRKTEPQLTILEIEQSVLGVNHGQAGAYLLDWWNLPLTLQEVALYHHDPLNENVFYSDILKLIYIANEISGKILHESKELFIEENILVDVKLSITDLEETVEHFAQTDFRL